MRRHTFRDMVDLYFDEKIETLPPDQLRRLQDHRLRWQFRRCWDGSEWYRARFEAAGLSPETFGGLADVERLPLVSLGDLTSVEHEAWRVAPREWVKCRFTAAASPMRSLTWGDRVHESDRVARANWAASRVDTRDRDLYFAPRSAGEVRRLGPQEMDPEKVIPYHPLEVMFLGPVPAYQCSADDGFHWPADQLLAEVVDPASKRAAHEGWSGELVVTDLVREASPLVRYRTGLVARFTDEPCACGRTSSRLTQIGPLR